MSTTPAVAEDLVVLGKIVSVHGVRGEVKVYSFTDPIDNVLDYPRWTLRRDGEVKQVELASGRRQGKVLVAKLKGLDDREIARTYAGFEICVPRGELPDLDDGEFYWYQLQGLKVVDQAGQLLGVVRLHATSSYDSGEYAVLVRSDVKGRGLGWLLMQMIIEYARSEGLERIEAQVLSENTTMLEMCRKLGFTTAADPHDPQTCVVKLPLGREG